MLASCDQGTDIERSSAQLRISRFLHLVGDATSRSLASAIVMATVVVSFIVLASMGFPSVGVATFATLSSATSLIMLFVIQHTQSRQQIVTQLKLDELIRTSPGADDLLMHIEVAEDVEIIEREIDQLAHHTSMREDE